MPTGPCHASPGIAGRSGRRAARLGRHGRRGRRRLAGPPCRPPAPSRRSRPLGDALGHRPAHGLAGEGVYRGREIEPPFACGHVDDAARPKPVAPASGESALCQVEPRVSRLDLLLDAAFSGRAPSGEPGLLRDMGHAPLAHGDAAFSQFAVDAPVAVAALVPLALSGRWTSSGRDARRNRISRLSSARMPS